MINTSSVGGLASTLKVGNIVASKEMCYYVTNVTAFIYALDLLAACPAVFVADGALIALTENGVKQLNLNAVRDLICSRDAFINSAELLARIRFTFPNIMAVKIEAVAIGHVYHLFNIRFVVVRTITDLAPVYPTSALTNYSQWRPTVHDYA